MNASDNHDLAGAILQVLEAGGPARAVRRGTAFLATACRCDSAGTFRERERALELVSGHQIDQAAINSAQAAWRERERSLRNGERVVGPTMALIPLRDGSKLVGALFLGTDGRAIRHLNLRPVSIVLDLLTKSIGRTEVEVSDWRDSLVLDAQELERDQLVYLLEQHEWNIARVARAKRVSRPTIYSWLERLGIERRRRAVVSQPKASRGD